MVRPIMVFNPRIDQGFAESATQLLDAGASTPEALQAGLRNDYPDALVRERDLSGETQHVWYVYREGHWIDGVDDEWG